MRKVLILSNLYPTRKAPTKGIFVKNIEQQLLRNKFEVQRCVVAGSPESMLVKLFNYMSYILRAVFYLLKSNGAVYIHFVAHSSLPLIFASLFKKKYVVAHIHGGDVLPANYEPQIVRTAKKLLARRCLKLSSKIIVPSAFFKQLVCAEYEVERSTVHVSPSGGVELSRFQFRPKKPQFINNGEVYLGYVGRVDNGKGLETLFNALALLKINYRCEIVGDGVLLEMLRCLAQELNITENVNFQGMIPQDELPEYYAKFDYLIFSSEMVESLGLVGLESMAMGTPVIGSMMGGMSDYLVPEKNGFGFEVANASSLAVQITKSTKISLDGYQELARNARVMAEGFDAKKCEDELVKIFDES